MAISKVSGVTAPTPGQAIRVMVDGKPVAVFNVGDRLLAVDAACTHVGGPLDRGTVKDGAVTCPLHGSVFDLATGRVLRGPAARPVRALRVRSTPEGLEFEPVA